MYLLLEETEKQAVRRALIEERGRFCTFITFLQPVVVGPSSQRGVLSIPAIGLVEGSPQIRKFQESGFGSCWWGFFWVTQRPQQVGPGPRVDPSATSQ